MSNKETFSRRHGHIPLKEKEITIREDAPRELRGFVQMAFYSLNKKPSDLRKITSRVLRTTPDNNNWSEYPNIQSEISQHLESCEWYVVYDIIEAIIEMLNPVEQEQFINEVNDHFLANGIGWKIVNGQIETRGDEVFETVVNTVVSVLEAGKLQTAKTEIREALNDLSRRPTPDITGAIQHSVACLECVTREFTGNKKSTLGDLMKIFPGIIPSPLDQVVTKIWVFASEKGRHLREGEAPEYLEAELVVEVTSAISTYLGKKIIDKYSCNQKGEIPF